MKERQDIFDSVGVKCRGMHHNCAFFSEQSDELLQDIAGLTNCVTLHFHTAGAASREGDVFKAIMETVCVLMPHGFH